VTRTDDSAHVVRRAATKRFGLADLVLTAHFVFAAYAVFGGLLALLDWRFMLVHVPTVLWSAIVNLAHWTCPLTPMEKKLRAQAGQTPYEGSWTQRYLDPLVRPLGMPRRMELAAGISILTWNIAVYAAIAWLRQSA